jgi:hypothetical protein
MSLYIARFLAVFPCREIGNSQYDPPHEATKILVDVLYDTLRGCDLLYILKAKYVRNGF